MKTLQRTTNAEFKHVFHPKTPRWNCRASILLVGQWPVPPLPNKCICVICGGTPSTFELRVLRYTFLSAPFVRRTLTQQDVAGKQSGLGSLTAPHSHNVYNEIEITSNRAGSIVRYRTLPQSASSITLVGNCHYARLIQGRAC